MRVHAGAGLEKKKKDIFSDPKKREESADYPMYGEGSPFSRFGEGGKVLLNYKGGQQHRKGISGRSASW